MSLIKILAQSISIAAVLGIIRFRKIDRVFRPFIYLCWLALITEWLSYLYFSPRALTGYLHNTYSIGEFWLITWQMYRWRVIQLKTYKGIIIFLLAAWFVEFIILGRYALGGNYFNLLYGCVIIWMSIRCLNWRLMAERGNLLKSPYVIICSAFILYFAVAVIVSAFWMHGLYGSNDFVKAVVSFHYIVNTTSNILYAIAILCMPRKDPFILPY